MKRICLSGAVHVLAIALAASSYVCADTNENLPPLSNPKVIEDDQIQMHAHRSDGTEENYEAFFLIPPAFWLFGSGMLLLISVARRKKST